MISDPSTAVKASTGNMLPNLGGPAAVGRVLDQKALSAGAVLRLFWTGCRIGLDISCWYLLAAAPEQVSVRATLSQRDQTL
jgi:hypothetical protein